MIWPFNDKTLRPYWLRVFALYAMTEAAIQISFNFTLNHFREIPISNIQFHTVMWLLQCLLIWPIWWVAKSVRQYSVMIQVVVNFLFFILYSYFWFGPVQFVVEQLHQSFQAITLPANERIPTPIDSSADITYLNYQFLKHCFRLSWFFLADYFYHYQKEEDKRFELATQNKELQIKLLKWHLNPEFYFNTIKYLQKLASKQPSYCTTPILQLAGVMEYVIYEAKEKSIAVSKELHFLKNYIELVNQQFGATQISVEIKGDYDQLRIAPLLLTEIIDHFMSQPTVSERHSKLLLQFEGNRLQFVVSEENVVDKQVDPALLVRIRELYGSRCTIHPLRENELVNLTLLLDE